MLKIEDAEADDVVATLMHQAVSKGMRVVVASPDMDFRQLLSEKVNMLLPLPEFGRWSFYTLEQYIAQNSCEPSLDLGLRKLTACSQQCGWFLFVYVEWVSSVMHSSYVSFVHLQRGVVRFFLHHTHLVMVNTSTNRKRLAHTSTIILLAHTSTIILPLWEKSNSGNYVCHTLLVSYIWQ